MGGRVEEKKAPRRSTAISSLSFHLSHIGDFIPTQPGPPGRYQRDHLRLKLNDSNKRRGPPPLLSPADPRDPSAPRAARGARGLRRSGPGKRRRWAEMSSVMQNTAGGGVPGQQKNRRNGGEPPQDAV
ncbi:hypothetical protein NQZ68_033311 [Dissostichus eleginoides]|nr:hypothetical protein NQZ68_033311 [Dissostichus eleginoides]